MQTYKVSLVGNGNVGKSTFLSQQRGDAFEPRYLITSICEVHPVVFHTSSGLIRLNIWDIAGQDKCGGLRSGYYTQSDAAIVMYNLSNTKSLTDTLDWHRDVQRVCPNIPTVFIGNKSDIADVKVTPQQIAAVQERVDVPHYAISSKDRIDLNEPFIYLLRTLTGDNELTII